MNYWIKGAPWKGYSFTDFNMAISMATLLGSWEVYRGEKLVAKGRTISR